MSLRQVEIEYLAALGDDLTTALERYEKGGKEALTPPPPWYARPAVKWGFVTAFAAGAGILVARAIRRRKK